MFRYSNLFASLTSLSALELALKRASRGRRCQEEVARFLLHREGRLLALQHALQTGQWRPAPTGLRLIYEPKPRAITISPFENNLVHHALVDGLEPLLSRSYLPDSYACREGRGAHRAILAHEGFQRRYKLLLQLDVAKYFPSISHERLLALLGERLRDRQVMCLMEVILAADDGLYTRPEVERHLGIQGRPGVGVPVGTLVSQFIGNFYLSELDHFIKRSLKVPGYLRYMDNMTCFGNSRAQLMAWGEAIGLWLEQERGLKLKSRQRALRSCQARILYLGYEVSREGHRPGGLVYHRLRQRLDRLKVSGLSSRRLEGLRRSLQSTGAAVQF